MFRIFVYGTLRVPNPETPRADVMYHAQIAHWVLAHEPARLDGAILRDFGAYPGIFRGAGQVLGDLLTMHPDALAVMDDTELPYGYSREWVQVQTVNGMQGAWVYWANPALLESGVPIANGDWFQRAIRQPLPRFRAGLQDAIIPSAGETLLGGFYTAEGHTPRPTVLLWHGVPGVEKNHDLAHAMRAAGWNCLYVHPRGSWGSSGKFSLAGQVADVQAAVDWLLARPEVDAAHLALLGNSFGGYLALWAGAQTPVFRKLIALAPSLNGLALAQERLTAQNFADFAAYLPSVHAAELQAEWHNLPSLHGLKAALREQSILLVSGGQDTLFPPPLHHPFTQQLPHTRWLILPDADHSFSACRAQLAEKLVAWLAEAG